MAGANSGYAARERQCIVDRHAPKRDEATGRGRRTCAEKNVRHCVVGRKQIVARLEARRTADCASVRHGGSQKPRPRGVGGTM